MQSDFDCDLKILSPEAAGELQALLQHIASSNETICAMVLNRDGEIIASIPNPEDHAPGSPQLESLAKLSMTIYSDSNKATRDLSGGRLHQIYLAAANVQLVIVDFGGGLLVSLCTRASDSEKSGHSRTPWSPGDPPDFWPPRREPQDPSRSPVGKIPSGGAGEIALPLPPPD